MGNTPSLLRRLREARAEDYADIARVAGVQSESAIRKWESGERFPGLHQAVLLADHFHVSLDELTGRVPLGRNAKLVAELDLAGLREALAEISAVGKSGRHKAERALRAIDRFLAAKKGGAGKKRRA